MIALLELLPLARCAIACVAARKPTYSALPLGKKLSGSYCLQEPLTGYEAIVSAGALTPYRDSGFFGLASL